MEKKGERKKDTTNSLGLLVGISLDAEIRQLKGVGLRSKERQMQQITRGRGHKRRKRDK